MAQMQAMVQLCPHLIAAAVPMPMAVQRKITTEEEERRRRSFSIPHSHILHPTLPEVRRKVEANAVIFTHQPHTSTLPQVRRKVEADAAKRAGGGGGGWFSRRRKDGDSQDGAADGGQPPGPPTLVVSIVGSVPSLYSLQVGVQLHGVQKGMRMHKGMIRLWGP